MDDSLADAHLVDRLNDFGMANLLRAFRPLVKLREARGPLQFTLGETRNTAPDLAYTTLELDGQAVFVLRVRFEEHAPYRIHYWGAYPPLPNGVTVRSYQPEDAPGCVALEKACAMEFADGSSWLVDRGDAFHDYLELMGPRDTKVVDADGRIVGFFSNALRPIRFEGEAAFAVYQHHYRVHPDFRSGSVSMALSSEVDSRRTFRDLPVALPYSLVDPTNVHMGNMSFPPVPDVEIARLALPLAPGTAQEPVRPSLARVRELVDLTHGDRTLYPALSEVQWQERLARVSSYGLDQFAAVKNAVLGVWPVGERNVMTTKDGRTERVLAFALDYGFADVEQLLRLVDESGGRLRAQGMTHLAFTMDTRAPEFEPLAARADDVQRLALHTLPWLTAALGKTVLYCDAAYT